MSQTNVLITKSQETVVSGGKEQKDEEEEEKQQIVTPILIYVDDDEDDNKDDKNTNKHDKEDDVKDDKNPDNHGEDDCDGEYDDEFLTGYLNAADADDEQDGVSNSRGLIHIDETDCDSRVGMFASSDSLKTYVDDNAAQREKEIDDAIAIAIEESIAEAIASSKAAKSNTFDNDESREKPIVTRRKDDDDDDNDAYEENQTATFKKSDAILPASATFLSAATPHACDSPNRAYSPPPVVRKYEQFDPESFDAFDDAPLADTGPRGAHVCMKHYAGRCTCMRSRSSWEDLYSSDAITLDAFSCKAGANTSKSRSLVFHLPTIWRFYLHCFDEVLAREFAAGNDRWKTIMLENVTKQTLETALVIVSYLALCPAVDEIVLHDADASAAKGVWEFLRSGVANRFTRIVLRACKFGDSAMARICDAMTMLPRLEYLCICLCDAGEETAIALANLMHIQESLHTVIYNANKTSRAALLTLLTSLHSAPSIRTFSCAYSTLLDEKEHKCNVDLRDKKETASLSLSSSSSAASSFAATPSSLSAPMQSSALVKNCEICEKNRKEHDEICDMLREIFTKNKRLRSLIIASPFDCGSRPASREEKDSNACELMFLALATNETLLHLQLIFNSAMTQERADLIANVFENNNTLKSVAFGRSSVEETLAYKTNFDDLPAPVDFSLLNASFQSNANNLVYRGYLNQFISAINKKRFATEPDDKEDDEEEDADDGLD